MGLTPGNWIQILALAITLLLFVIPIVYYAGKLVAKLETINSRLTGLEATVVNFQKECFTKTDAGMRMKGTDDTLSLMWKKIDKAMRLARAALFKQGINPDEQDEDKP